MKFISAKPLVIKAQKEGYAVPAFNTNGASYDITRAALEACQELNSPLILQVYEPNLEYRGFEYFVNIANFLCEELKITIPVALQVDHAKSFSSAQNAINAGLTSVMFDASNCPLDENVKKTREVVDIAHIKGISIEAEVGYVKGNEPENEKLIGQVEIPLEPSIPSEKTSIDEAVYFTEKTDVDMLAVAIGTTHGVYRQQKTIDFVLLKNLQKAVSTPLVMHGTCGISLENLERLSKSGISKINFGEPFRYNYINYFNKLSNEMEHLWHPWKIMQEVKKRIKEDMKKLIKTLGSSDKAN